MDTYSLMLSSTSADYLMRSIPAMDKQERRVNVAEDRVLRFRQSRPNEIVHEPEFTWAIEAEQLGSESQVVVLRLTNPRGDDDDFVRLGFSPDRAKLLGVALNDAANAFGRKKGAEE